MTSLQGRSLRPSLSRPPCAQPNRIRSVRDSLALRSGAGVAALALLAAMTAAHQAELRRRLGDEQADQVRLMRSFGAEDFHDNDLDIADPWYGGADDFDLAWEQIRAAAPHVVSEVSQRLTRR